MPLLLVSPVETVAGRRARVSDSQLAPLLSLSLSHSFFLFSRSTRQPRGEYTFLDKRVTWRRGNACPLSQDSIRTSLESKYGGIAVNISSRVFFFLAGSAPQVSLMYSKESSGQEEKFLEKVSLGRILFL